MNETVARVVNVQDTGLELVEENTLITGTIGSGVINLFNKIVKSVYDASNESAVIFELGVQEAVNKTKLSIPGVAKILDLSSAYMTLASIRQLVEHRNNKRERLPVPWLLCLDEIEEYMSILYTESVKKDFASILKDGPQVGVYLITYSTVHTGSLESLSSIFYNKICCMDNIETSLAVLHSSSAQQIANPTGLAVYREGESDDKKVFAFC